MHNLEHPKKATKKTIPSTKHGAMDKALGHVTAGTMISGLGLWQLFNHIIRLFSLHPDTYVAPAWFPAPRVRYLELLVMLVGGAYGFFSQMFWYSMPFNADGSIPEARLPNHEHAIINAALVLYAGAAAYLDRARVRGRRTLCALLLALVYAQELFMFHVHSTDHAGVEGQFHWFVQAIVATCLATALIGAGFPRSFAVSLVRSAALTLQGVWFLDIGVMWLPGLIANGCALEDGGLSIRCHSDESEHHAKAVINLQFGWCLTLMALFVVVLYSYVCRRYPPEATYGRLPGDGDQEEELKAGRHCVHELMSLEIDV